MSSLVAGSLIEAPAGLEGVVVAETTIGDVRGREGYFHYRGTDATDLARTRTFEEVWHLLLVGHLPDDTERDSFAARASAARARIPARSLGEFADQIGGQDPMGKLRTVWSRAAQLLDVRPWGTLTREERLDQAIGVSAIAPIVVASTHGIEAATRLDTTDASTAASYLAAVLGRHPSAEQIRALEQYLILTVDHGLNASTFTARTVTSTGADLGAVVVAALGALSGPLHGGAPSLALEMLDEIAIPERAEPWVRGQLARGQRIMGFGHRIYRTEDPRATLLRASALQLDTPTAALATHVEEVVRRVLDEVRSGRELDVNVEYWAAVVLDAIGLPRSLFTPTFALARSIGWVAHALEQMQGNRIVRPTARYIGPASATDASSVDQPDAADS